MIKQITQLTSVIFKEFLRNPGIIFWAILFPILMAWGLGLAFTKQDQLIRSVAWIQNENGCSQFGIKNTESDQTETILAGSEETGITTYQLYPTSMQEGLKMLKKGKVTMIIDESGKEAIYHFDSKNPEAQLAYLHITKYTDQPQKEGLPSNVRPIVAIGARYVDFLVPGLISLNIMMSCLWGISYSLIDKRIKKLLRRMVATPMKKSAFMIAQFLARLGLGGMEVAIIFLFSYAYFGITIQGGIGPFLLMFLGGNIAFTGIAILVSSRTSNTQIGNGLINLVVMPMMIFSGIFFSYHGFPDWVISIIELLPLTLLANSIRSVFNEGATFADVLPDFAVLSLIGILFFSLGIKIYKWY